MRPRINGLLNIVCQNGATELHMGTDKKPRLFKGSAETAFTMPVTSEDMLRHYLGDLFSPEVEAQMRQDGEVVFEHVLPSKERFRGRFKHRNDGFDVFFALEVASAPLTDADTEPMAAAPAPPAPQVAAVEPPSAPAPPKAPAPAATVAPTAPTPVALAAAAPPVIQVAAPPAETLVSMRRRHPPRLGAALSGLLSRAVHKRASDLHLAADQLPIARIDGRLTPMMGEPPVNPQQLLEGCLKPWVMQSLDEGVGVDLSLKSTALGRFRVHLYQARGGLSAAIRILPEAAPSLKKLGLPADIGELALLPGGLVIMAGPTGSGKSTTLAALAQHALEHRPVMMVTLEDPIEYEINAKGKGGLVRQREIGRHARDYTTGLRDALREDPDIIVIGEMRDTETIELALTAAETGHLVLTHLHARSASSAIERIIDACPHERQSQIRLQLADSLQAVISQRLLPRSVGRGRLVAMEVLRVNRAVSSMIREGRTAQIPSAMQSGASDGMLTMERCLATLVQTGQLDAASARAIAYDQKVLAEYMGR